MSRTSKSVDSDSAGLPIFTVPESHQQHQQSSHTKQQRSPSTGAAAAAVHGSGLPVGPPPGQSALVKAKFNIFKAAGSSRQLGGGSLSKKDRQVSISPTLAPSAPPNRGGGGGGDDAAHHGDNDGEFDSTTLYDGGGDQSPNDGGISAMTQGSSVTGDPLEDTVSSKIKAKAPLEVLQELNAHVLLALNRIEEQHRLHGCLKHCQAVSMIQAAAEGEDLNNINNTTHNESRRESIAGTSNSADNSTSESPPTSFHSDFGARCESVIMSDKRTVRGLTSTSFYSDPLTNPKDGGGGGDQPMMDGGGGGSSVPTRTYSIWRGGTFNSFMVSSRGLDVLAKMKGDAGSGGGMKRGVGGGGSTNSSGGILSDLQKHCLPPEPRSGHCPEWRHRIAALEMNELLRVSAPPPTSSRLTVQALRDLLPSSASSSQSLNRNRSMANLGIGMSFRFQRETSVNTAGSGSPEYRPAVGRKGSMSPLHLAGSEPPPSQRPQPFSLGPSSPLRGASFDGGRQNSGASGNSSLDFRSGGSSFRGVGVGSFSPTQGAASFPNNGSFFCDSDGEPDRECTLSDVIQGIRYLRASTHKRRQRSDQYRDTIAKLQKKKDVLMEEFENTRTAEWLPLCPMQPPGIGVASQITQLHRDIVWEPTRRVSRQRQNHQSQTSPTATLDDSIQQHFSSITAAAAAAGKHPSSSTSGAGVGGGLSPLTSRGGPPVPNMLPPAPTSSKHLAKMLDEVLQEVRRLVHPLDHKGCLAATKKLLSAGSKRITELDML